ncbi:phosphatase PAP2 family protein [Cellulosimicrobium funkei]|nr:phosphatase PAP2 family protein [Cellulosimicrobium funkei]
MHRQQYPPQSAADPFVDRSSGRWLLGAGISILILFGSYLLAVWTPMGQALENAALRGADQVNRQDVSDANNALHAITIVSLGLAIVVVVAIALVRRRPDLAVAGAGVIVLGQVITQGLKRFVLPRPELVEVTGNYTQNSFPSGHTTIAMTVLFALIIVVPYRWRGVMMFFVWPWAVGIGAYTITAKWHRFSDTLGAMAVALLCACLASWWLARRGQVTRHTGRAYSGRVVLVVVIALSAAVALALGGFLWAAGFAQGEDFTQPDSIWDYNAYLGANTLAAGCAGVATLAFWALWHRRRVGA